MRWMWACLGAALTVSAISASAPVGFPTANYCMGTFQFGFNVDTSGDEESYTPTRIIYASYNSTIIVSDYSWYKIEVFTPQGTLVLKKTIGGIVGVTKDWYFSIMYDTVYKYT